MQLRIPVLSLAFLLAAILPLAANPLESELAAMSNSCWERTYDAAHLKAHPKQLVTKIRLSTEVQDDGNIYASLGINLRQDQGRKFDYSAFAPCQAKGAALSCPSEWDAGAFSLEKAKGGLLVRNKDLIVNPSNYDAEDVAPNAVSLGKSDDAAWLLMPSADEGCDLF